MNTRSWGSPFVFYTFSFHRAAHLRNHISTVHEKKKPFLCTLCGNSYPSDHYLKSHIKSVHEGERRFKCPQCDAKFSQKSGVRTHIECVHEGLYFTSSFSWIVKWYQSPNFIKKYLLKYFALQKLEKHEFLIDFIK